MDNFQAVVFYRYKINEIEHFFEYFILSLKLYRNYILTGWVGVIREARPILALGSRHASTCWLPAPRYAFQKRLVSVMN